MHFGKDKEKIAFWGLLGLALLGILSYLAAIFKLNTDYANWQRAGKYLISSQGKVVTTIYFSALFGACLITFTTFRRNTKKVVLLIAVFLARTIKLIIKTIRKAKLSLNHYLRLCKHP